MGVHYVVIASASAGGQSHDLSDSLCLLYRHLSQPAFYRQVFPLLPVNSLHNWLVFLSMPIVAISVMNILTTLASFLKLDRLVISLFILLSASAQYFIWNFGVVIDRSMITNILDTTPAESFALLSGEMIAVLGLSGVLAVFVARWVKIRKPATRAARRCACSISPFRRC